MSASSSQDATRGDSVSTTVQTPSAPPDGDGDNETGQAGAAPPETPMRPAKASVI
ncbi:hypothetical protein IMZ48_35795 [Candidatus Bathyarchaeota archaeon]|nr:hypothetical protein [Candidatus Bathyarchaeota archaeon]